MADDDEYSTDPKRRLGPQVSADTASTDKGRKLSPSVSPDTASTDRGRKLSSPDPDKYSTDPNRKLSQPDASKYSADPSRKLSPATDASKASTSRGRKLSTAPDASKVSTDRGRVLSTPESDRASARSSSPSSPIQTPSVSEPPPPPPTPSAAPTPSSRNDESSNGSDPYDLSGGGDPYDLTDRKPNTQNGQYSQDQSSQGGGGQGPTQGQTPSRPQSQSKSLPQFDDKKAYLVSGKSLNAIVAVERSNRPRAVVNGGLKEVQSGDDGVWLALDSNSSLLSPLQQGLGGLITVTTEDVSGYTPGTGVSEVDSVDTLTFDQDLFEIFDGGGGQCVVRLKTATC